MNDEAIQQLLMNYTERYLTKKEIMYRLPSTITIDAFWPVILQHRRSLGCELPLFDQSGNPFWMAITEKIREALLTIDTMATENFIERIPSKSIQETVITDALIDEAFNSSVIEGAFSTKKRTRELVEKKLLPTNKSEQMIINNYHALNYILENLHKPIDEDMILSIYQKVVENTLDPEDIVEKYRDDAVYIYDPTGKVIYEPPHFSRVLPLMNKLIEFINNDDLHHPIIKACIIHFYFVYVHPFFDGNGRTARALSYMYLLKQGYTFFKFFSISSLVREERPKYYKAIKDVEDNDSDLTYFIDFYTQMIIKSIFRILNDISKEYHNRIIDLYLNHKGVVLSSRQRKALKLLIKNEKNFTDAQEYMKRNRVAYETARTDLNQLVSLGLMNKSKEGKKYLYILSSFDNIVKLF